MTSQTITVMALAVGIVFGAAVSQGFDIYRQSHNSQAFQERVRCKTIADDYVKRNADLTDGPTGKIVTLDKVDYSPARNSCVAEVEEITLFKGGSVGFESVRDLLSGETLFSMSMNKDSDALKLIFLPRVWDVVMKGASKPVDLDREYAATESKLEPKATSPQSAVAEPNDWQSVQPSKSPQAASAPQQKPYIDPNTGERIPAPQSAETGKQDFYPDKGKPIQAHGQVAHP